jgi:predicted nucleic acid-binding protein
MFYLDTCIWLNLFKKEGDASKGVPYWKIAEDFVSKFSDVSYSDMVIRELKFHLSPEQFEEKLRFLKKHFRHVQVISEDYLLARMLESKSGYTISFYDCIHIAICKRCGFALVTRDRELIEFAAEYVCVHKPECLLS